MDPKLMSLLELTKAIGEHLVGWRRTASKR
jgi:hypothetical protein